MATIQKQLVWPELGRIERRTLFMGETAYTLTIFPLLGIASQPLAHLLSLFEDPLALQQRRLKQMTYIAVLGLLLLAALGLYLSIRHALRPFDQPVVALARLAQGELNVSLASRRYDDEVGQLMQALQRLVERLREIIGGIHRASDDLQASAGTMAALAESTKIQFDHQKIKIAHVDRAAMHMAQSA
ncbi:methyl-accepting chemotaxis protein [Caldichromatium japonicum]|uniref:Methyl-accepting chemotaxis protein n=1 Tax=Caldichromatium japonicum TaxID=2699430 RepID=A0A6G7VEY5_9GAMM|nr:methyl-accepting chemotaxis protein [Caldichromatium japonicum]QIK38643.1 methyl-accepting chemotaxis protein [Caldichromatium japonicum]